MYTLTYCTSHPGWSKEGQVRVAKSVCLDCHLMSVAKNSLASTFKTFRTKRIQSIVILSE